MAPLRGPVSPPELASLGPDGPLVQGPWADTCRCTWRSRTDRSASFTSATKSARAPWFSRSRSKHDGVVPHTSSFLLSSLELSDTKVYAPHIRAVLGTASHFCELVVLKLRTVPIGTYVVCQPRNSQLCCTSGTKSALVPAMLEPRFDLLSQDRNPVISIFCQKIEIRQTFEGKQSLISDSFLPITIPRLAGSSRLGSTCQVFWVP